MQSKQWPTLLCLLAVTAMPVTAQRAPVTSVVTVQVPAIYRIQVDPTAADEEGLPVVNVITNIAWPAGKEATKVIAEALADCACCLTQREHAKGGGALANPDPRDRLVRYTVTPP